MFGFFTDAIENTLDVAGDLLTGELPDKSQIVKLIDAGITIAAISSATGIATDIIEKILEE